MNSKTSNTSVYPERNRSELPVTNCDSAEATKTPKRSCLNCRFQKQLHGVPGQMYICRHKEGVQRTWWRVDPADSCNNFEAPHVTQAQIEEIEKAGAKVIPLTQGKVAIVDPEDFERLKQYNWCAVKGVQTWYAYTLTADGKRLSMHRLVANAPKRMVVDHINHNGLDNRKSNVRLCTKKQNSQNIRPRKGCSSRYKGVFKPKDRNSFRAIICHNGKHIHLGYFKEEIDAAKAYDLKARELFGEFAYLNFPSSS